jgi:hypothetical protein
MPVVWCPLLILNIVVMSEHVWHSKVLLVSSSKLSRSPSGRDSRVWPSACIGPAVRSPGDDSKDGIQPSGGDNENIVQPPGDDSRDCNLVSWRGKQ